MRDHPEYANSPTNGFLDGIDPVDLENDSRTQLAVIDYLLRVAPEPFHDQFYRTVSSYLYGSSLTMENRIDSLYLIDLRNATPVPELLLPQLSYGNAVYRPTNPAWSPDGKWIALEYTTNLNDPSAPSFLGVLNLTTRQVFALQPENTRGANGLFYDGDPQWWQGTDKTLGWSSSRGISPARTERLSPRFSA